jgi:hypothetical protein
MMPLFPRSTVDLRLEEPAAFRRFSMSIVETAVVTGIVIRLYRALVLANSTGGWIYWAIVGTIGTLIFCAMVTAHLANYPVRRWVWRAPVFATIAVAAEMATSLVLIALGREPTGSVRAEWSDWPSMAANALLYRGLAICAWAAVLALAVWTVRRLARGRHRA